MEIRDKQGKTHKKEVTLVKGHPENPLSWEALREKFYSCIEFAGRPVGCLKELPEKKWELEEADNIVPIIKYLALKIQLRTLR